MHLEIRGRIPVGHDVRSCVERRVAFALRRFGSRIGPVTVWLDDLNGPRGGTDKACRITVTLPPAGQVIVQDADGDFRAAVSRVAERAGRAVARQLARRRDLRAGARASIRVPAAVG